MRLYIIVLVILCIFSFSAKADELTMFSDRDVYVSGEKILIDVFIPENSASKVVYVGLTSFSGDIISETKLLINNNQSNGYINIPDSVRTGSYKISSFIQRKGEKEYFYKDVFIANRFDNFISSSKEVYKRSGGQLRYPLTKEIFIDIGNQLSKRDSANLTISFQPGLMNDLISDLNICISKYSPEFETNAGHFKTKVDDLVLFEEDRGIILSGTVINKDTKKTVRGATVYLSIPDSIPGFQYYQTKADGKFYFLLKEMYGEIPIVIQAIKENMNEQLKVVLDKKYSDVTGEENDKSFRLKEEFIEELNTEINAFTYDLIFHPDTAHTKPPYKNVYNDWLFYGQPMYNVDPDLFYDLPNFNEVSKELLLGVKFRDRDGKLSLNIIDRELRGFFEKEPLVLLDGIPIQDLQLIKNLGSNKIDWIHTVLSCRFFGDLEFQGVVAIYSGSFDLEWLKQSDRLLKFDYHAFQPFYEYKKSTSKDRNDPDMRTVLLSKNNVKPKENLSFDFITSDIEGHFRVQLRCKKSNGEIIVAEKVFIVN